GAFHHEAAAECCSDDDGEHGATRGERIDATAAAAGPGVPAGKLARKEVDGSHPLVLDPQADGDGERAELGLVDRLRDLEPAERVADAHRDAEQPLELLGEAAELRGAAGHDDFSDPETARLRLVVGERGDELAGERLDAEPDGLARAGRLLERQALRRLAAVEREVALHELHRSEEHTSELQSRQYLV